MNQKEVKWLHVQGASGETIIGELREAVVDKISFSDKEASEQSTRESKRKRMPGQEGCSYIISCHIDTKGMFWVSRRLVDKSWLGVALVLFKMQFCILNIIKYKIFNFVRDFWLGASSH